MLMEQVWKITSYFRINRPNKFFHFFRLENDQILFHTFQDPVATLFDSFGIVVTFVLKVRLE